MFLGWSSTKFLFFIPVGYSTWLPVPIICSDWLKFQRSSSLKLMNWLNPNCKWMIIRMSFTKFCLEGHWKVLYKVSVFLADRKSKMATTAGHRLTLDPMGKCSNAFFSETTNMIKALCEKCFKTLLLWNHMDNWNQTAQEWSLEGPLHSLGFLCRSEIQDGHHHRT